MMLSLPASVRIWLATSATDLRKSFDTLAEVIDHAKHNVGKARWGSANPISLERRFTAVSQHPSRASPSRRPMKGEPALGLPACTAGKLFDGGSPRGGAQLQGLGRADMVDQFDQLAGKRH